MGTSHTDGAVVVAFDCLATVVTQPLALGTWDFDASKSNGPAQVRAALAALMDPELPGASWARAPGNDSAWSASVPTEVGEGLSVYLDRDRVKAIVVPLLETVSESNVDFPSVTLQLFEQILPEQLAPSGTRSLVVSASAWSALPSSDVLRPPGLPPDVEPRIWLPDELPDILDGILYQSAWHIANEVARRGSANFARPELGGKRLLRPVTYLVFPDRVPETPEDWLMPTAWNLAVRPTLQRVLMSTDEHDERLAANVTPDGTLALYRRPDRASVPVTQGYFLFLPYGVKLRSEWEGGAIDLQAVFEQVDEYVAWTLWDVDTEFEMLRDRLADLQTMAADASNTMNPLLRELLNPQQQNPERLRDAVELVRATLIQGGPEFTDYRRRLQRERTKVDNIRDMYPRFAHGVGIRRAAGLPSIIDRLLEPADRQRIRLDESLSNASQDVDSLVASAAAVLAERREQALAGLAGMGFLFNVVLLFFAVGTAVDLLVDFKWAAPPPWLEVGLRVAVLIVVLAGLGGLSIALWRRSRARHGSQDLQQLRARAVGFVQRVGLGTGSSAEADHVAAVDLADLLDDLDGVDAQLMKQLANISLPSGPTPAALVDYLVRRAEWWSIRAVLLVERPFPLTSANPLVACLYHFRWNGAYVSHYEFGQALGGNPGVDAFRDAGARYPRTSSAVSLLDWVRENIQPLSEDAGAINAPLAPNRQS